MIMIFGLNVVGCNQKKEVEYDSPEEINNMNDIFAGYINTWIDRNGKMEEDDLYEELTLKQLEESGFDISAFVNPTTKKPCDKEKTMASYRLYQENGEKKIEYSISLACDLKYADK